MHTFIILFSSKNFLLAGNSHKILFTENSFPVEIGISSNPIGYFTY